MDLDMEGRSQPPGSPDSLAAGQGLAMQDQTGAQNDPKHQKPKEPKLCSIRGECIGTALTELCKGRAARRWLAAHTADGVRGPLSCRKGV